MSPPVYLFKFLDLWFSLFCYYKKKSWTYYHVGTQICGHKTQWLIFDSRTNSVPLSCTLASTLKNGSLLKKSGKAAVSGAGSAALRPWQHCPSHPSACVVPSARAPLLSSTSHSDSYCGATSWGHPRPPCLAHPTALHLAVEYSKAKSKGVLLLWKDSLYLKDSLINKEDGEKTWWN